MHVRGGFVDQAEALRRMGKLDKGNMPGGRTGMMKRTGRGVRVIAVTSGKGGVGKTNIAANLGYLFATMGKKVLLLDADAGLANIDVILGITPKYNLCHLLYGEKQLLEVITRGPGGMMIIPAVSGIEEMAELSRGQKLTLLEEFEHFDEELDIMIIDTAAGIAGNVMYFNMAAHEVVVVVTPEPTSLTDSYALIKVLNRNYGTRHFMILANMVSNAEEAQGIYSRLSNAASHFLNISVDYLGYVYRDPTVTESIRQQSLFTETFPSSRASKSLAAIARKIFQEIPDRHDEAGMVKFFGSALIDRDD